MKKTITQAGIVGISVVSYLAVEFLKSSVTIGGNAFIIMFLFALALAFISFLLALLFTTIYSQEHES